MRVRSFKGYRRPNERIKRGHSLLAFRGVIGKTPRRVLAVVLGALVLVILLRAFRAEPVLMNSAEIATVWDNGVLRVGVRADVPGMAENGAGLEIELAQMLAEKIMRADPDWSGKTFVEFVTVSPMDVAAKLSDGSIDVAISLMPANAFSGYSYSRAYYQDTVCFLTRPGEENISIKNITIGCIQDASTSSLYVPSGAVYNTLTAFITAHPDDGFTAEEVVRFASYEDLFRALEKGDVDVVALNSLMIGKYRSAYSFGISPVAVGSIDYAIACLSEKSALASVADLMLSDIEQDGTLDALKTNDGLR